jgi:hypothetical protein
MNTVAYTRPASPWLSNPIRRTHVPAEVSATLSTSRARACGFRRNHCGSPSSLEAVSAFGGGRKDAEITARRYPTCTLADRPKGHRDHRGHQLSSGRPMLPMTPDRRSQVGGLEFHADESASADALPRARDVESVALATTARNPRLPSKASHMRSILPIVAADWKNQFRSM